MIQEEQATAGEVAVKQARGNGPLWALGGTVNARPPEGLGCRLADGDVIRVPVGTFGPERDDDVRAEVVDDPKDILGKRPPVDPGELAVRVVEAQGVLHAEDRAGLSELPLSDLAQGAPGGSAGIADLSALPTSRRYDHGLRST